jgi:hypothetical protein
MSDPRKAKEQFIAGGEREVWFALCRAALAKGGFTKIKPWANQETIAAEYKKPTICGWIELTLDPDGQTTRISAEAAVESLYALFNKPEQIIEAFSEGGLQPLLAETQSTLPHRWMVGSAGQQLGPLDAEGIRALIAQGKIDPKTVLVWREGLGDWLPMRAIAELGGAGVRFGSGPAGPPNELPGPPAEQPRPPAQAEPSLWDEPSPPPVGPPKTFTPIVVDTGPPAAESARQRPTPAADGRVDLNNASLEELLTLPGFNLALASRLVQQRGQRRGFQTLEELGEFLALPPHKVAHLVDLVLLAPPAGSGVVTSARKRVIDF